MSTRSAPTRVTPLLHPRAVLRALPLPVVLLATAGCDAGGDGALVARAGDYELTVNETVTLVTGAPQLPNEPQVIEAVGELWVDYTLLAEAARRDSTMEVVDLEPLVQQQVERRLILTLRDSVIEADTAVTEPELRTLFEEERPGVSVEARHILLVPPENATDLQQDSVRRLAQRIRQQAATGTESLEDLARQHSQDPGSAQQGGRIGTVERGQSIPAIEDALFALEPGEISPVVETPFGFHIFRIDARNEPGFEDIASVFRGQVQQRRYLQAESTYIAAMLGDATLDPVDEAADLTRRMAEDPGARLSRRAADRAVVRYGGGQLTLGEVLDFMQTSRPEYRSQVVQAPDSVVEDEVLLGIVQRELLLQDARERGMSVPDAVRDSLTTVARERFVEVAAQIGVLRVSPAAGQSPREAVEARVESILREMLSGSREVMPLGAVAYALRKQFANEVYPTGVEQVVQRVAEARGTTGGGTGAGAPPGALPGTPPPTVPDVPPGGAAGTPPDTSGGG